MFSIVTPMDCDRLELFANTKRAYDEMPQVKEFIIPTRSEFQVGRFLDNNNLAKDVKIIPYRWTKGFNPAMALNIGVKNAQYENIIITCPEVLPTTDVLRQLEDKLGQNIICQVFDENEDGSLGNVLVNTIYRSDSPAMYFLAMFNKKDIEIINGWDEDFMRGYAYEDNDFGERWKRAGLPFVVDDSIKARHQYHPREETIKNGLNINANKFHENTENNVVRCKNGLNKL